MIRSEEKYFNSNRENWNGRVSVHKDSAFYNVAGFKKGKNALNDIELSELGDVSGKDMLHLQCHFGLDTMSWSRLGAKATGVDFSEEAIRVAKDLSRELGLNTKFICSNVYDLKQHLDQQFDCVFTSYGVIGWLPDLNRWAEIINHFLKTGGTFYMAEFHPVIWMFDNDFTKIKYSYFNDGVIEEEQEGTYADRNANVKSKEYSWNHSISEVVNALTSHGLSISFMNEYDYSPYDCFANTVSNPDGNYYIKGYEKKLPMIYSIKAIKTKL